MRYRNYEFEKNSIINRLSGPGQEPVSASKNYLFQVSFWMLLLVFFCVINSAEVEIVGSGGDWQVFRDGEPYFIKGAGGSSNMDMLIDRGGNSVRTWGPSGTTLDNAQQRGITVCMGISTDESQARDQVEQYKDHPALLMWGIGNEEEMRTDDDTGLWQRINRIAQMIHEVDGSHPAITVVAELGGDKLSQLMEHAPDLDAVGINTYGSIMSLADRVENSSWDRPFIVTEFGPRGHWEVDREEWGVPIEQSSTEKSAHYLEAYQSSIENRSRCLGSYVFLWGQKQEKTHTWYGMFLPGNLGGNPLNPVDAMTYAWTGQWPENRCPDIGTGKIKIGTRTAVGDGDQRYFPPGYRFMVELDAFDPDEDPVRVAWDLRYDVTDNTASGGAYEPSTSPIEGAVVSSEGFSAVIQLPDEENYFRVHAYVYDDHGNAATVNQGIVVDAGTVIVEPEITAPSIITHPQDKTVEEGGTVRFTVYSEGYPLNYQWFCNGDELTGETLPSLEITSVSEADDGAFYSVNVYNDQGSETSGSAVLSVVSYGGPVIPSVETPPQIDADVDELWAAVPSYNIENVVTGNVSSVTDLSGSFRAVWDTGNLYVIVEVTDDLTVNNSETGWQNDGVEIFTDVDNSKESSYNDNHRQYRFQWNSDVIEESSGNVLGVTFSQTNTTSGYRMEMSFPWIEALGKSVETDDLIGFDLHINDNDGDSREGKLAWFGTEDNAYFDPSAFGTMKLIAGEPAQTRFFSERRTPFPKSYKIKTVRNGLMIQSFCRENAKIEFIAPDGRIIKHRNSSGPVTFINTGGMAGGIYLVRISGRTGSRVFKRLVCRDR